MLPNDEQGRDTTKKSLNKQNNFVFTISAIFRQGIVRFQRRIFFNFRIWDFFDRFFDETFLTPAFFGSFLDRIRQIGPLLPTIW